MIYKNYFKKWLLILWLIYAHQIISADYSDVNQYGNKTANLASIKAIIDQLKNQNIPVEVPEFMGIAHDEVKNFLQVAGALEQINDVWEQFKSHQRGRVELTDEGKAFLVLIRTTIDEAFKKDFFIADSDRNQELQSFLKRIHGNNLKLMVRSTGKEDSKEMANAGGNESIANVEAEIKEISLAMSRVLQSYFSEKSFNQRIAAGESEISLFSDPFFPVLLQVMVGEKAFNIPTSGVAFSREILGNTPQVVSIDATFGHGEAVVNSLYPADTFYVGPGNLIHAIIRIKHTRLSPKEGDAGLMPVANDKTLQKQSSLSPEQIHYIAQTARALEEARDEAIDMEFVVLSNQIYVVQVRPIVEAKNQPSYLSDDFVNHISINNQVSMSPIVSGGGELKEISSNDQVIIADKIGQALDIYLSKNKEEQERILLVISGENAPQTSHEATTFRSNNKPVMYVRELDKAKAIITSNQHRLADVQRGQLYLSETFNYTNDRKVGWLKHPIAETVSIHPQFLDKDIPVVAYNYPELAHLTVESLLDLARHGSDYEQAKNAVRTIMAQISNRIESEEKRQQELAAKNAETNPQLVNQLKVIYRHIKYASGEVLEALTAYFKRKGEKSDQDELLRLYPINFLSALISQVPEDKLVIAPYSIGYLLKTERQEAGLVKALSLAEQDSRKLVVQYARIGAYGLSDVVTSAWGDFLQHFDQVDKEDQKDFSRMIYELAKFDVLPLWLNVMFYPVHKKNHDPKTLAKTLIERFDDESALLNQISQLFDEVSQFPLNQLGNPKKFNEISDNFREQILSQVLNDSFLKSIANGSILAKSVGVSFLNQFIAIFDNGIKSLTASTEYPSAIKKAKDLTKILKSYLSALRSFAAAFITKPIDVDKLLQKEDRAGGIGNYIQRMENLLYQSKVRALKSEEKAQIELLPSSYFNAAAAKLGSQALWGRSIGHYPTLEDIFTLTHQNLLVITAKVSGSLPWHILPVPSLVKSIKEAMTKLKIFEGGTPLPPPSLIGVSLNNDRLSFYFNQTLQNHSNTFEIIYNLKDRSTIIRTQFLGDARRRWPYLAMALRNLVLPINDLQVIEGPYVDLMRGLLSFAWIINNNLQVAAAAKTLENFGNLANDFTSESKNRFIKNLLDGVNDDKIKTFCKTVIINPEKIDNDQVFIIEFMINNYKEECQQVIDETNIVSVIAPAVDSLLNEKQIDPAIRYSYAMSQLLDNADIDKAIDKIMELMIVSIPIFPSFEEYNYAEEVRNAISNIVINDKFCRKFIMRLKNALLTTSISDSTFWSYLYYIDNQLKKETFNEVCPFPESSDLEIINRLVTHVDQLLSREKTVKDADLEKIERKIQTIKQRLLNILQNFLKKFGMNLSLDFKTKLDAKVKELKEILGL